MSTGKANKNNPNVRNRADQPTRHICTKPGCAEPITAKQLLIVKGTRYDAANKSHKYSAAYHRDCYAKL